MLDDAIDEVDEPVACCQTGLPSAVALPQISAFDALSSRLTLFDRRLEQIYAGTLDLPPADQRDESQHALHAFALTVGRYEIPRRYFQELAEGCRMDLTVKRYETWVDLDRYCYHVAGVVGLIMCCVLGLTHSAAAEQAVQMGSAMQLTNILRDIGEDHARGRIYLPQEDLARFAYTEADLAGGVVNGNFRQLMRFEIARARGLYRGAFGGLCWLAGERSRLTGAAMGVIYSGILDAIERQGYDVYSHRASLDFGQKVRRLPLAWRLARRRPDMPMPHIFPNCVSVA